MRGRAAVPTTRKKIEQRLRKNCVNLQDKLIIVTGAAGGLGQATAADLSAAGARLALVDLDADALQRVAESLDAPCHTYTANIADEEAVDALFKQIASDCGPQLHGLVNNAGITRDGLLVKSRDGEIVAHMTLAAWQAVIDVNLTGVFLMGRAAAAQMISSASEGVIVNIASISRAGNMGQSNYAAAKAGVAALSVVWAQELARYGIRVASISPGFSDTQMVAAVKPEALEKLKSRIPVNRLGHPSEIAQSVRFCFENDYLTGRDIAVDGGLRI
jgi:3-oxoacyl-[acyl-carrier protein] reductase